MGDRLTASALLERLATDTGFSPALIAEIFHGVPVDFPVTISRHLPLGADRLGMAGITIGGHVYLVESVRRYPSEELIRLLRHEAEHVRQQRSDQLFYLRYGWQWLREMILSLPKLRGSDSERVRKAFHDCEAALERHGLVDSRRKVAELVRDLEETGSARFWR